ncbi:MAG: protoporphyrinogen oxidase HemJ [Pseudomonadota bacterium]
MNLYPWVLSLHVFSAFAWMAGLWYLPRLFVYHQPTAHDPSAEPSPTLMLMARRLLRVIMNPAALAVWVFGFILLTLNPAIMAQPWFHLKLTLVVGMSVFHMVLARHRRLLAEGRSTRSARFYRLLNEVPTVLLLGILISVLVRPF